MKVDFKVSPLFFVLIVLSIFSHTVLRCFIYILIVILHEFAHYAVAQRLGYELNTLHLMPYGAALSGDMAAASAKEEITIALAGPIFNILCAIFFVALWWLWPAIYVFSDTIVWANTAIALFNFLPVYPLDGGRILYAILRSRISIKKANIVMKISAVVISVLFCFCCLLSVLKKKLNFSMAIAAIFIMSGTFIKDKSAYYQNLYSMTYRTEKIKKGLEVREIMVFEDETIGSLLKKISSSYYTKFIIVDKNIEVKKELSETELLSFATKVHQNSMISNIIGQNNLKSF